MSDNKNKYFVVSQTSVVKALNKTEAQKIAAKRRSSQVLWSDVAVDNIAAADAHQMASSGS